MKDKFTFELKTSDGVFLSLDVLNSETFEDAREAVQKQCPGARIVSVFEYKNGHMVKQHSHRIKKVKV
ncbi:hypothetical protein V6R21_12875 [Limibacter armeniacum]|uniref:hypothetical protein n=1 Tax=Limibacter armeniacum TaxID=466084 RepID=UPI002FE528CB